MDVTFINSPLHLGSDYRFRVFILQRHDSVNICSISGLSFPLKNTLEALAWVHFRATFFLCGAWLHCRGRWEGTPFPPPPQDCVKPTLQDGVGKSHMLGRGQEGA